MGRSGEAGKLTHDWREEGGHGHCQLLVAAPDKTENGHLPGPGPLLPVVCAGACLTPLHKASAAALFGMVKKKKPPNSPE